MSQREQGCMSTWPESSSPGLRAVQAFTLCFTSLSRGSHLYQDAANGISLPRWTGGFSSGAGNVPDKCSIIVNGSDLNREFSKSVN